jgi:hypothetical protein
MANINLPLDFKEFLQLLNEYQFRTLKGKQKSCRQV